VGGFFQKFFFEIWVILEREGRVLDKIKTPSVLGKSFPTTT
jgi:hypothetical protein